MIHNTYEQNLFNCRVRKAEKRDVGLLRQVEQECFLMPYTKEICESLIYNSDVYLLFIAKIIVGYASVKTIPPEAELYRFAIRPMWQRKKFGSYFWNFIEQMLLKKDIQKIYLEVSEDNEAAIKFYQKLGFTQYHIRKNYYQNGKSALCLEKSLLLDNQEQKDGREYGRIFF